MNTKNLRLEPKPGGQNYPNARILLMLSLPFIAEIVKEIVLKGSSEDLEHYDTQFARHRHKARRGYQKSTIRVKSVVSAEILTAAGAEQNEGIDGRA